MTLNEVSKLTGISSLLLIRMRSRQTITLNSGPPFCKTTDRFGNTQYVYKKADVLKWMKSRRFRVTAGDAASILGVSRDELLGKYGHNMHCWEGPKGKLVICAGKNIFVWVPKLAINPPNKLKKIA